MSQNALADAMGADFERLDPLIQAAHRGRIQLTGTAEVTRGRGLGGWLASILGMPAANSDCPMSVEGEHLADAMHWSRNFAGHRMNSVFRRDGNHLVEQMGPIRLRLRPLAEVGRLVYRLETARIGILPLPQVLTPRLTAWEREVEGRYSFEVDIGLPLVGRLVRYRGKLDLQSAPQGTGVLCRSLRTSHDRPDFDSMTATCHALFFLAIGPVLPLLFMPLLLEIQHGHGMQSLLRGFSSMLSDTRTILILVVAYLIGGTPAFLTGWLTSYFIQKCRNPWLTPLTGLLIGGCIAGLGGLLFAYNPRDAIFFAACGAGAGGLATLLLSIKKRPH